MPTVPAQTLNGKAILEFSYSDDVSVIDYQSPYSPYTKYWTFSPTVKVSAFIRNSETVPYTVLIASPIQTTGISTPPGSTILLNRQLTIDGKTVYFTSSGIWSGAAMPFTVNPFELVTSGGSELQPQGEMAWLMVYGDNIPDGFKVFYDMENCSGDASNPLIIPPNATITTATFNPNPGTEFTSTSVSIDGSGFPEDSPVQFNWNPTTGALRIGPVTSDITIHVKAYGDPYSDTDGTAPIPGGGSVGVPGLPGLTATSTGIIGLFAPSAAQMQALAGYMWTDFGGQGTTEVDVLKEIVEAIKRSISNPLDYVVGLNIIPSQGLSVGAAQEIRFGFVNTGISMPRLSNQYFTVDCGSIYFDYLCDNTFLDYAPYSKFSIYLPYIGVKELDANDCVGHTIGVYYHGDTVTGGITAYITKDGSVMYQFSGCCALNVPLSADGWGSTIAGAVQIATSMVSGGISGGAAGVVKAAAESAASVAANPSLLSRQISHSGAVSGGAGCMGIQYPFIIREAVSYHSTAGFNTVSGYPSFYYRSLGAVGGYTVVYDVHLQGIPATRDEIDEIETLLKEGVVF